MRFSLTTFLLTLSFAVRVGAVPVNLHVVGPNNTPVAGAQLALDAYAENSTLVEQTDLGGNFSRELQPIADKQLGSVVVYAKGFALLRADLRTGNNELRLQRERFVAGVVTDKKGVPMAGANVKISNLAVPGGGYTLLYAVPTALADVFSTRTQADGSWILGGMPEGGKAHVALEDPAFVRAMVAASLHASSINEAPPLVALAGASIAGRVVDEAGEPVAGVEIFTPRLDRQLNSWAKDQARSGADGRYRINSLPAGTYSLALDDPTGKRAGLAREKVVVTAGQALENQDFRVEKAIFIEGTIRDETTGTPLAKVSLEVFGPHRPKEVIYGISGVTDAAGHFILPAVPGNNRLYLSGPRGYFRRNLDIPVAKSENKPLDLTLAQGVSLSGTTIDESGRPVGGVFLFLFIRSANSGPDENAAPPVGVTSDATGQWKVSGLAPGEVTFATSTGWDLMPFPNPKPKFQAPSDAPIQVKVRRVPRQNR